MNPTTNLWCVTVEYELVVAADSNREAETKAESHAGADGSGEPTVVAIRVKWIEQVPDEWKDSIPFGGDTNDERTCRERLMPNTNP